jgi:hypothetical protein
VTILKVCWCLKNIKVAKIATRKLADVENVECRPRFWRRGGRRRRIDNYRHEVRESERERERERGEREREREKERERERERERKRERDR